MVVLSGAHTIGKARCATFSSRFSSTGSGSQVFEDQVFIDSLQQLCTSGSNNTHVDLDLATPSTFDNQYYINLISGDGLLPSDQALLCPDDAGVVEGLVAAYAADAEAFFEDFKGAMTRMGRLAPPAGSRGEVRSCCRVINS
ncbi:Peroxidase 40 [Platanthera guangdongensis]|uniref:Peroxidase 40 n=1 Tax=Platanthera guangdongensis TaxID=2320717 RepID=A0ABR2MN65_9ASPA